MSFLKSFLPAPIVDLLPILLGLVAALLVLRWGVRKLKDTGLWDRLMGRLGGEKLRQMQFDREIARRKKQGDLIGAAQLYEEAEYFPEAINLYREAEEYTAAGALYEKLEQWDRAADSYTQSGDWKRSALVFVRSGKPGKAAEIYEEHGQKIDAAKLYFEAGRFDRAAVLYEEVSYFPQAAKAFEKVGDYVRAAENYERHWAATTSFGGGGLIASPSDRESKAALVAGQLYEKGGALEKAAAIYQRAGLARQAAELAARQGRFLEAAEMFLKEEKLEQAAEMFEKAGNTGRAALLRGEVAFHRGDNAGAAQEFLKGGDNLRAAELFEGVGDLASAAKCYELSDSPLQAANVYLRAQKKEEAAAMFERGREFETAAKLFEETGQKQRASVLYEKAGRFYEGGRLACELRDAERAIQLLQQIDSGSENYESASLLLARLFIDKDMAPLAVEKLVRALGDRAVTSQTLDHFYVLGLAYEKLGKNREAIDTFKRVMAQRYGYEDVEQRLARLGSPGRTQMTAKPAAATVVPERKAPVPAAPAPPRPAPAAPASSGSTSTRVPPAPPAAPPKATGTPPLSSPGPAAAAQPRSTPAMRPAASKPFIQVAEEMGRGLLGATFKGVDTRNGRPVAVKFLRDDLLREREVVERFLAEARVARSLEHPGLVRLLGLTEIAGRRAAIMEYVEGVDLGKIVTHNKRLSMRQALDLLSSLSVALGAAHQAKVLHCDLKMTNVLVSKEGKLRLTGIGLGALRTPSLGQADGYPAPEFLIRHPPDERSDVYSLGAMIYHGLTGQHPAGQKPPGSIPPSLRQLVPAAPEAMEHVLSRCLASQPSARFGNMGEVLAAVRPIKV